MKKVTKRSAKTKVTRKSIEAEAKKVYLDSGKDRAALHKFIDYTLPYKHFEMLSGEYANEKIDILIAKWKLTEGVKSDDLVVGKTYLCESLGEVILHSFDVDEDEVELDIIDKIIAERFMSYSNPPMYMFSLSVFNEIRKPNK